MGRPQQGFVITALFGAITLFSLPALAQTTTFTVRTTSDVVVANACQTNGAGCSLRGAIQAANPVRGGAIIQFNIPSCGGVCVIILESELPAVSGPGTRIVGPGADRLVIVQSIFTSARIFSVTNTTGSVSISGVTLRNGTDGVGGSISKVGAGILDVTDVSFDNNRAARGGAIYASGGTLNLLRSFFTQNSAFDQPPIPFAAGGAIFLEGTGVSNITNCTFLSNTSTNAGAIFSTATTNISNSTIARNTSTGSGGGISTFNSGSPVVTIKSSLIAENTAATAGPDVFGVIRTQGFNLVGKTDGSTGFIDPTDLKGTIASPLDPKFEPNGPAMNGGATLTLAISPQSPAIDKGSDVSLTGLITTDQRGSGFLRRRDNPAVSNAVTGTDIGAFERHVVNVFDFDGDGKTDVGIFRPPVADWWIYRSSTGSTFAAHFGSSTDKPVPADYTGDGKTDIAFWRPSTGEWFILRSEDGSFFSGPFGTNGDIPVPADYDADGKADLAVFRPSTGFWFIVRSSNNQSSSQLFGTNGDQPIPNDYDGDGRADLAIYRPSAGEWWLNRTTAGTIAYSFGANTDKIVPGDYTGDGKTDVAFWRPSTGEWFVLRSENSTFFAFAFGTNGDIPAPGDFDGDGKFDATVFRPLNATWFILRSLGGTTIQQFGANGDRPIPSALVP